MRFPLVLGVTLSLISCQTKEVARVPAGDDLYSKTCVTFNQGVAHLSDCGQMFGVPSLLWKSRHTARNVLRLMSQKTGEVIREKEHRVLLFIESSNADRREEEQVVRTVMEAFKTAVELDQRTVNFLPPLLDSWNHYEKQIEEQFVYQVADDTVTSFAFSPSREAEMPHDFFGFLYSKNNRAVIGTAFYQSILHQTMTFVHELFHLFDPYVHKVEKPTDLDRVFFEYRAYLAELQAYSAVKAAVAAIHFDGQQVTTIPSYERRGQILQQDPYLFFQWVLEKAYPDRKMIQFALIPEGPSQLYTYDGWHLTPVATPLDAKKSGGINVHLAQILGQEILFPEKIPNPQQKTVLLKLKYFSSTHEIGIRERKSQQRKNRQKQQALWAELYRRVKGQEATRALSEKDRREVLKLYLQQHSVDQIDLRGQKLLMNDFAIGGPRGFNDGD